ncbi:FAD binding domain-containing protein [Streptomyces sp. S1A(2023)]
MDLAAVRAAVDARGGVRWEAGDAWLAGGTWLFSTPQPEVARLWDVTRMGWQPLTVDQNGLEVAATCTVAELLAFAEQPDGPWPGGRALMAGCCRAFSSSFKVWNTATVGGNVCLALPAAPMVAMAVALNGVCVLRSADGRERQLPMGEFVTGAGRTCLQPGEMLRCLRLPAAALAQRTVMRRVSLRPGGHSAALVIATSLPRPRRFTCMLTAATTYPVHLSFDRLGRTDAWWSGQVRGINRVDGSEGPRHAVPQPILGGWLRGGATVGSGEPGTVEARHQGCLEAFVLRARRVEEHSLAADWDALVALTTMQISVVQLDNGETRVRQEFPAEEVLESAAARLRPILLNGDACFYQKALGALGYFCRALPLDTEWVKATRAEWRVRVDPSTPEEAGYWVMISDMVTGEDQGLDRHKLAMAWIYGDVVHHDMERRQEGDAFGLFERFRAQCHSSLGPWSERSSS